MGNLLARKGGLVRGILGGIVFIGGVGALGWWATAGVAPEIEQAMGEAAEASTADAMHAVAVDVSGRDVTVSGLADSEEERAAIIAALAEVPGQRVIRDELEILPPAEPFTMTIARDGEALAIEGFVPTESDRARLEEAIGPGASVLTLASGAPDADWTSAAISGFEALSALKSGELTLSDTDLTLTGLAATPVEEAAAMGALAALPEGYSATTDIDVEDDGRPFALIIDYVRGGTANATGKLPVTMTTDVLTALEANVEAEGVAIARIPSEDGMWPEGAAGFIAALAALEEGSLTLTDRTGTLIGVGTRAGIVAAEDVLASLPASFTAATEFTLFDDGAPLALTAEKTADGTEIAGKLPFGAMPEDLGLDAFAAGIAVAQIDARSEDFVALAARGLGALAETRAGTLTVEDAAEPSLTLTGRVSTPMVAEMIEASLADAPGLITTDLNAMDDGSALSLRVTKDSEGLTAEGKLPRDTSIKIEGPTTASIAMGPEGFEAAAVAGLAALDAIAEGALDISGTTLSLEGRGTRAALAAALEELDAVPETFTTETSLLPLDDGLPLGLTAEKTGERIILFGKMPFGTEPEALGLAAFGEAMIVSEIDANSPGFVMTATKGLRALSAMESGTLVIADGEAEGDPARLTLTGDVTRAGLEAVNGALGGLPAGIAPVIDVVFADDGRPMALSALYDGMDLRASGKLPFGTTPGDLGIEDWGGSVDVAEIDAQSDGFLDLAAAGIRGLLALESGEFSILDGANADAAPRVAMSGIALSPRERETALAGFGSADVTADITTLDDGTPPNFTLSFDITEGATLSGKLHNGLTSDEIASRLGLNGIESSAQMGFMGDESDVAGTIAPLATWLPEMDAFTASYGANGLADIEVTPVPGVDAALLADGLEGDLGIAPTLTAAAQPSQGATRFNLATERDERFTGAAWLPNFTFPVSRDRCDAETRAILRETRLNFVTGSSDLDARSHRAINGLAGAILHCLASRPTLMVEVGGHTDSQGSQSDNARLSQNRAEAVRQALIERRVPGGILIAAGYGEIRPIASNDTAEGRAANRRTELTWFEG